MSTGDRPAWSRVLPNISHLLCCVAKHGNKIVSIAAGIGAGGSMLFNASERKKDLGLLLMRLGLAALLLLNALPELLSGPFFWRSAGAILPFADIGLPTRVIGMTVLILEVLGALGLFSGYLFRMACAVLGTIFGLYCLNYYRMDDPTMMQWSMGLTGVCLGLIFTGPGRYAFSVKFTR
jgi:uncharacterized membrane protein YphA (DoxX/SURF4 family)